MSTELFDAKGIADEIHEIANVPPALNDPHFYNTTIAHLETLIKAMDEYGMTMGEQRMRVGRKKDELISELIRLRERGVAVGYGEPRRPRHVSKVDMSRINIVGRN